MEKSLFIPIFATENEEVMAKIIGRKKEQDELLRILNRQQADLVAVYGRRRVGKTFLIRETLKEHFVFYHTGISPIEIQGQNLLEAQLTAFASTLTFSGAAINGKPKNWIEAFDWLRDFLTEQDKSKRIVVFLDEMPWMDTPRSGFMSAFEHFWNGWASGQENLMMVVCGSATSWIEDHLINNYGGLYGRTTAEIQLSPFTLYETEQMLHALGVNMSRYDIVQTYMAVGGIPYYLSYFQPGKSLAQMLDILFFNHKSKFQNEFDRLFNSIFISPDRYKKIVRLLAKRHIGYSRDDISIMTGIPSGKDLTKMLRTLESSDFIIRYKPFENDRKHLLYRLTDPFCLFYLRFVEDHTTTPDFWTTHEHAPAIASWRGIAFEDVCLCHIPQLKSALGISGVATEASPWTMQGDEGHDGMQIDLILDRNDRVVSLCEMKFTSTEFNVDKSYDMKLRNRIQQIQQLVSRRHHVQMVLVTTFGLKYGVHSGIFQQTLTADDLFTP